MNRPPAHPSRAQASPLPVIGGSLRWALRAVWTVNRRLTLALVGLVALRGLPPAGLAVAAKGLVDAVAAGAADGADAMPSLAPWLALAFVFMLAEAVSPLASRLVSARLQEDLNLHFSTAILEHAGRLDPAFFETGEEGRALFERARQGSTEALAGFVQNAQDAVSGTVQALSLIAILGAIEPLVLVIVPPAAIPYLLFQYRISRRRFEDDRSRTTTRRLTRHLAEQITGERSLAEVHLLRLTPLLASRYRDLLAGLRDARRVHQRREFGGALVFGVLTSVALFGVFLGVARNALTGAATLGGLAVFGGAAARLRYSLTAMLGAVNAALENGLYIADLRAFLTVEPRRPAAPLRLPDEVREIEFRDVTFTYPGAARPAVDGLSFRLRRGETVALVGENGAGKTTVTRILAGVLEPERGEVRFDGIDLRDVAREDLQREIGMLPQVPTRFEATAAENIAFGDWQRLLDHPDEIDRIARDLGLEGLLASFPRGAATPLGRIIGEHDPSGGQWQQLGIARAFAHGGGVLILDEPTSQLDARAESELLARLRRVAADRATLLVSHRFTTLRLADRILVLSEGRLVENGTHAELMAHNGLYAQLYRLHRGEQPAERAAP